MSRSRTSRFLAVEGALIMLGFAIAAQLAPPDPYTQVLSALVILLVTVPCSYWLVYERDVLS